MCVDEKKHVPASLHRRNLFASRIHEASGFVQTNDEPLSASFWGEILLHGHFEDDRFIIEQVRRVALYGSLNKPAEDLRIGTFSLLGSLTDVTILQDQNDSYRWIIENLHMRLHYAALTKEAPPFKTGTDGVIPQVEEIKGHIIWTQDKESTEKQVLFTIEEFVLSNLVKQVLETKTVEVIGLNQHQLAFSGMRTEPYELDSKANSLPPDCGLSSDIFCPGTLNETFQRELPIKFISFSLSRTFDQVDAICQDLIQRVCDEVWGLKGALNLKIETMLVDGTTPQKNAYANCNMADESQLPSPPDPPGGPSYGSVNHVEVYMVDALVARDGGAVTRDLGMGSVYCILEVAMADENEYLLAHELCHVLGLAHSDETGDPVPGSADSIADPDDPIGSPVPNDNTRYNLRIFDPYFDSNYLNPMVLHKVDSLGAWIPDCFHPDAVADSQEPEVIFLDSSDNTLDRTIPLPPEPTSLTLSFKIHITDSGLFPVEFVSIDVIWRDRRDEVDLINFAYNGTAWAPPALTVPPTEVTIYSPVDSSPAVVHGDISEAIFNVDVQISNEYKQIEIEAHVTDYAGNTVPAIDARHVFNVAAPTDMMLLLDYSGSMRATDPAVPSKWDSAKKAANLFNAIFSELDVHGVGNRIGLVRFFANGPTGADLTEVTRPLAPPTTATPLVTSSEPTVGYFTPMGTAVVTAHDHAAPAPADWRNRIMILLTDGKENRNPKLAAIRTASSTSPNFVPNLDDSDQLGYRIYTCAFGLPGEIDSDAIDYLAEGDDGLKSYNGKFHSTESAGDPEDASALIEHFLSLIADTTSAEIMGPILGDFNVDPGVEEMICILTAEHNFTVDPPDGHPDPIPSVDASHEGFRFMHISNPTPGVWSLGGFTQTGSRRGFVVLDLTLTTNFNVGRAQSGVGSPIPLSAEIMENGVCVSGATVTVEVEGPGESMGQILSDYTRHPSFKRRQWQQQIISKPKLEPLSLQRQLLEAAFDHRGFGLRRMVNQVTLTETEPGHYAGVWSDTLEEGTYSFRFKATGQTHDGYNFQRNYIVSQHVAPVPDPAFTTIFWSSQPLFDRRSVLWQATIVPHTASGRPLGPGLADKLTLRPARHNSLFGKDIGPTLDNLNGSYKVEIALPFGQKPPLLTLGFDNHRVLSHIMPTATPAHRVQFILKRIKVLDDKEPWFLSPGELIFHAAVMPNGNPDRAMYRRIPTEGFIELSDGESEELDLVLFDGYMEDGATLEIIMGGMEIDNLLLFSKSDQLARYRRRFTGDIMSWVGTYAPDDEPDDPEALNDWQLWYEIVIM